MKIILTGVIEKEDDIYVALCPELDVASQGYSVDEARGNLVEALELFFEFASPEEFKSRCGNPVITKKNLPAHTITMSVPNRFA